MNTRKTWSSTRTESTMKVVFVDIHALLRDAHLYLCCLACPLNVIYIDAHDDMIWSELSWMQAWMSWYALRNAAKLKNKYSSAWRTAGKHNRAYSTTLCGAGKTPCRRFQPFITCLGVFDEDVYHLAASSAASCLDNWLGSKLPRITRLHRSEALGSPIHY